MSEKYGRNKLILLCTIIPNSKYFLEKTLRKIDENFKTNNGKVFVLKMTGEEDKLILTYNIIQEGQVKYRDILKSTFQVHRKKDNNVLYTLNALNMAIVEQCGKKDQSYKLDWTEYKNSLLIVRKDDDGNEALHRVPTLLNEIIELEKI
jgi:hypothetical protein